MPPLPDGSAAGLLSQASTTVDADWGRPSDGAPPSSTNSWCETRPPATARATAPATRSSLRRPASPRAR
ncbi:hypothetical protein, partial [Streptomyces sp. NPDC005568]|uniref:hypothetical protein n=1 Tax=Streptomyces sp. NPDC005568 TaxID=3156887 RepID=UPI0033A033CA